jgi:hypothetical protein
MFSRVTPEFTGTPGWFAPEPGGVKLIAKNGSGSAQGFSSQFQFAPGERAAVIILMNQPATASSALANELLREVCGLPLPVKAVAEGDSSQ